MYFSCITVETILSLVLMIYLVFSEACHAMIRTTPCLLHADDMIRRMKIL